MDCPICASAARPWAAHPEVELFRCTACGHAFSRLRPGVAAEPYDADYFEATHRNWFQHPNRPLFERIAERLRLEPRPLAVIDVGCGNGAFLRYLAASGGPWTELVGLDIVANAPERGIEFVQADAIEAPVGRRFGAVVSLAVIEHIADVRAFARRLRELVDPGGLVVVMTINDSSLIYALARALRLFGFRLAFDRLYSRHHLHHFTQGSLASLLEGAGLLVEETIFHNAPLRAIDMPAASPVVAAGMRLGVAGLFALGAMTGRTYLQTAICRAGARHDGASPAAVSNS